VSQTTPNTFAQSPVVAEGGVVMLAGVRKVNASFVNASVQSVLQQQGLCAQTGVKNIVFNAIPDTRWLQITNVSMTQKLKHLLTNQRCR
jgi:hypothetical protein